jgi:hypothetical protein
LSPSLAVRLPGKIVLQIAVSANAPERAAVGNVTGTTMNEQLLLRQP